jgi:hypothetical protein
LVDAAQRAEHFAIGVRWHLSKPAIFPLSTSSYAFCLGA